MSFLSDFFGRLLGILTPTPPAPEPEPAPQSIAAIAAGNGNFDILVAALDVAGLTDTFVNPGDFTVFAPTDEAFTILARDTLGIDTEGLSETDIAVALVDTLGVPTLTDVLLYHVSNGSSTVEEIQSQGSVETLLGGTSFGVDGNTLSDADPEVEDPELVAGLTDIEATNGVIHVIDRVLLPIDVAEVTPQPTIADIALGNDNFEALVGALVATGLVDLFTDPTNDFTVFAPTDDAFRALAEEVGIDTTGIADADLPAALVSALGADLVRDVLLYHVQAGGQSIAELQEGRLVETALEGGRFVVDGDTLRDADPGREDPNFVEGLTDLEAVNGEVHVIDAVLLPLDIAEVTRVVDLGTSGDDVQAGGGANDVLIGLTGDDIILAGAGNDFAHGNIGNDQIFGGSGNDILRGGQGQDLLDGGLGNDFLQGGRGDDWMIGGEGNDTLRGRWGDDLLEGGDGDDRLMAGRGEDTLVAGHGDDMLFGGRNADTFEFTTLSGDNVITDFSDGDMLVFDIAEFADAQAVWDNTSIANGVATITGTEGTISLSAHYLDESDFVFV